MDIITDDDTKNPYLHAKVYKLVNNVDDKIYIGSTCNELSKRKHQHKSTGRRKPYACVYHHLNEIGWSNVSIILIEEVKAYNKNQLRMREQHYIELLKPELNSICAVNLKCPHNKIKYVCVECKGVSTCPHNIQKSQCRECKGSAICSHDRRKSRCKECGGGSICPHDRIKYSCVECDGGSICPHNRIKSQCRECKGSAICSHKKRKSQCKECNKDKYYCHECEISFCSKSELKRHYNTKIHNNIYNRLIDECFNHQ